MNTTDRAPDSARFVMVARMREDLAVKYGFEPRSYLYSKGPLALAANAFDPMELINMGCKPLEIDVRGKKITSFQVGDKDYGFTALDVEIYKKANWDGYDENSSRLFTNNFEIISDQQPMTGAQLAALERISIGEFGRFHLNHTPQSPDTTLADIFLYGFDVGRGLKKYIKMREYSLGYTVMQNGINIGEHLSKSADDRDMDVLSSYWVEEWEPQLLRGKSPEEQMAILEERANRVKAKD